MARKPPALCLALALLPALAAAQADSVRVYRCVASNGTVALQDSPCRSGEQQIRDLQRPRDPPPRSASSPPAAVPTATATPPAREIRYVQVQPPQPMYACVDAGGHRYVSDSNEGNQRWVPLWTTAWVPGRHGPARPWQGGPGPRPRPPASGHGAGSNGRADADHGDGRDHAHRPPGPAGFATSVPAGSILVRDTCNALPQQEVCSRLRDRRWELDRRYNSALQSERDAIVHEQRGIDARLGQDCSGR